MLDDGLLRDFATILASRSPPGVAETLRIDDARVCIAPGQDGAVPTSNPNFAELAVSPASTATERVDAILAVFAARTVAHFFFWVMPTADTPSLRGI